MLSKASLFPNPTPLMPTGVLAIRHANDCVSSDGISGTLTLFYARGTVHISWDSEFFDFGDSAVVLVRSRGYYCVCGKDIVCGTVLGCGCNIHYDSANAKPPYKDTQELRTYRNFLREYCLKS